MSTRQPSPTALATAGLLAVTATWGSTFFLIKDAVERVPVADYLAVRFALAALALTLIAPRALSRLSRTEVRHGVLLGLLYGGAQVLQTSGLQHTSASVSGFVTGMYVVLTPLLGLLLLRTKVGPHIWVAVGLATAGLGVLSLQGLSLGSGELVTLSGALLFAGHILGLGLWSSARSAIGLTVLQLWVVTAVCSAFAAPGGITTPSRTGDWVVLVYAALVAGALALVIQTWAQAHLPATRAAVLMTAEPVWAAGFAVVLGGEAFGTRLLLGGGLVLMAMYVAEVAPTLRGRPVHGQARPEPQIPRVTVNEPGLLASTSMATGTKLAPS